MYIFIYIYIYKYICMRDRMKTITCNQGIEFGRSALADNLPPCV